MILILAIEKRGKNFNLQAEILNTEIKNLHAHHKSLFYPLMSLFKNSDTKHRTISRKSLTLRCVCGNQALTTTRSSAARSSSAGSSLGVTQLSSHAQCRSRLQYYTIRVWIFLCRCSHYKHLNTGFSFLEYTMHNTFSNIIINATQRKH